VEQKRVETVIEGGKAQCSTERGRSGRPRVLVFCSRYQ